MYWDALGNLLYVNNNSSTAWTGIHGTWDVILSPTGTNDAARIQTLIDGGAGKILLLAGTWDVSDQNVTLVAGVEIFGQTRVNTILDFGTTAATTFKVVTDAFLGNLTVANAPTDFSGFPVNVTGGTAWNIDFSSTSGNGCRIGENSFSNPRVLNCIFQGVPDANTPQLGISACKTAIIKDCGFFGAEAAGSAIQLFYGGQPFFPVPNVTISGCYGVTKCNQGWVDDFPTSNPATFSIVGNNLELAGSTNAAPAVTVDQSNVLLSGNNFLIGLSQGAVGAMVNVTGGKVVVTGNNFEHDSVVTDVIKLNDSGGGHIVSSNRIVSPQSSSTNAIHLAGLGDKNVISNNSCPGGDIRIGVFSGSNVVALNIVNAVIGSTTENQIGLNVTGA